MADLDRTGVWLVGALGNLATTVVVGLQAISRGWASRTGLLTEREPCRQISGMVPLDALEFGGHDIRNGGLSEQAERIQHHTRCFKPEWLQQLTDPLRAIDENIRPGTARGGGAAIERLSQSSRFSPDATGRAVVQALRGDLEEFRQQKKIQRLILVNVSSTEPPPTSLGPYADIDDLESSLDRLPFEEFRPGLLYSYAGIQVGAAILNFTPSESALCPAIQQYARRRGVAFMGSDGKTGETLVKSALAPLFRIRQLQVNAWTGYNILGNRDGEVLAESENKNTKIESKDRVISEILGYSPETVVGIDFVRPLGEHKVAWDFIHFSGFLDYAMSMHFLWQGCDSILAAPLVIDLIRLTDLAMRQGRSGSLRHLAMFFKSPLDCCVHDLQGQFGLLQEYLRQSQEAGPSAS